MPLCLPTQPTVLHYNVPMGSGVKFNVCMDAQIQLERFIDSFGFSTAHASLKIRRGRQKLNYLILNKNSILYFSFDEFIYFIH